MAEVAGGPWPDFFSGRIRQHQSGHLPLPDSLPYISHLDPPERFERIYPSRWKGYH